MVVRYLLDHRIDANPEDRWSNTPLGDAACHGHHETVEVLEQCGARRGPVTGEASNLVVSASQPS